MKKIKAKEYMNWDKTITNELTPLEALQDLSKLVFIHGGVEQYKIIETALKRLEELDSLYTLTKHNGKFYVVIDKVEFDQISKQLKALEIVKEKGCSYIEKALIVSCKNYEEYCFEMNSGRVYLSEYERRATIKTKEEYDLLKEVLF